MTPRWGRRSPVALLGALLAPSTGAEEADRPGADQLAEVLPAADRHNLVPAVWSRLVERGDVEPVPASVRRHVAGRGLLRASAPLAAEASHAENGARIADLLDQADGVLRALTDAGLRAAPLKGVDALLAGRYRDPAARTMTDVDVLVDAATVSDAAAVLAGLGYAPVGDPVANDHQLPALVAAGRAGSVELHTALATARWSHVLDPVEVLDAASVAPDGTGRRLRRTDSLTHLVLHAQLHDEAHRLARLPLRSLHETALALAGDEDVEWDEVLARFAAAGRAAALRSHLEQVHLLFGVASPLPSTSRSRLRARAVVTLDERPVAGHRVARAAYLPRALSAARMAELHGATGPGSRARARAVHLARGLARPTRPRPPG